MKTRKMNYQQHLLYTNLVCQVLQYNDFHILIDLLNYRGWRASRWVLIIIIPRFPLFVSNGLLFMIQILGLFLKKKLFLPNGLQEIQFRLRHFPAPRNFLGLTCSSLHPLLLHLQLISILLLHLHIHLQNLRLYHFVSLGNLFYHFAIIFHLFFKILDYAY